MKLELDHFFILVEPGGAAGQRLLDLGLPEGSRNQHPGQGTSNRRFFFANGGMLELLWVHDEEEANAGPGQALRFVDRQNQAAASPFGIILRRKDNRSADLPYPGWTYQPDYFTAPMSFHIGENSENVTEPLCIYASFIDPEKTYPGQATLDKETPDKGTRFNTLSEIIISTPCNPLSAVLEQVNQADKVTIQPDAEHLIQVVFDGKEQGQQCDLRPQLPMVIHW